VSEIVVNEWLLHYMAPGSKDIYFPDRFLDFVQSKSLPIVIKRPSPFTDKYFRFCKVLKKLKPLYGKRLFLEMNDSNKVRLVKPEDILLLPAEIENLFQKVLVKEDDRYLVELVCTIPTSVLVTTDNPLVNALKPYCGDRVQLLPDFCRGIGLAPPAQ